MIHATHTPHKLEYIAMLSGLGAVGDSVSEKNISATRRNYLKTVRQRQVMMTPSSPDIATR